MGPAGWPPEARKTEEQKKSLSLAERKRQALTLNKSNQDRTTKAQTTQKQIEDQRRRTILKERDLASVPPGYYRGLINIGEEEALMLVMLGNKKPVTPTYPPNHPLAKIKRQKLNII